MSVQDVAAGLMSMWKAGQFDESGEKYWADDVVSYEPMDGPMARIEGKEGVRGKSQWWASAHEVHSSEVEGPAFNGDQFIVRFKMDVTVKETGKRMTMDEMALYTIKNDKIAEERFFYGG